MTKPRKSRVDGSLLVSVVSDAAMAGPVADGKLVPVLILDVQGRPDVSELIRQHQHLPSGEASHQWASSRDNSDRVMLLLNFERPSDVRMAIPFSIEHQGILVDSMIRSGAVYLQAGAEGDRLSATLDEPKILVELPDTGFGPAWEALLEKRMTKVMSTRMRVSRRKARPVARRLIKQMREFTALRMGS